MPDKKYKRIENSDGKTDYVDIRTGELFIDDGEAYRITSEKTIEQRRKHFEKNNQINSNYKNQKKFLWLVYKEHEGIIERMKPAAVSRIIYLSTFIDYEGKLINNNGKLMTKQDIMKQMNLKKQSFFDFFKEITENKVVIDKNNYYEINKEYFYKGTINPLNLKDGSIVTRIYISAVRELYLKASTSSHKHMGYIFKLIPYINREYNVVCSNPFETDVKKIKPLTLNEVCDILHYDKNNAKRLIAEFSSSKFQIKDSDKFKGLLMYISTCGVFDGNTYMVVNPQIYYGGKNIENIAILGIF